MAPPTLILHHGRWVLRVDYSELSSAELPASLEAAARLISREPRGSVLMLTIVNAHFDAIAAEAIKRYSADIAPHLRASAVVGATPFRKVLLASLKLRGRKNLEAFDNEPEALAWLVSR